MVWPQVDDRNIISPTLSLKKGYVTYGWTHLLGEGGRLKAVLDPFEVRRLESSACSLPHQHAVVPNVRVSVRCCGLELIFFC
jgi:hypothetical protein